jgi:hypothetical protein
MKSIETPSKIPAQCIEWEESKGSCYCSNKPSSAPTMTVDPNLQSPNSYLSLI